MDMESIAIVALLICAIWAVIGGIFYGYLMSLVLILNGAFGFTHTPQISINQALFRGVFVLCEFYDLLVNLKEFEAQRNG
ncbi:hypothetical protein [Vibrio sp. R78045]|uniref:hypothetical protein n=1 Tax=Vibrio sp. R78045 TaxID=3093868 RepID=UPI0036F2A7A0